MSTDFTLFASEAHVLRRLAEDGLTRLPELTTTSRMTPTEVFDVISRLAEKEFVRPLPDLNAVQLTETGNRARRLLERQDRASSKSAWSQPRILIIPDEAVGNYEISSLGPDEVGSALDAEIDRLAKE